MKTQNTNLVYSKSSIVELNEDQLQVLNGGSANSIMHITTTMSIIR